MILNTTDSILVTAEIAGIDVFKITTDDFIIYIWVYEDLLYQITYNDEPFKNKLSDEQMEEIIRSMIE